MYISMLKRGIKDFAYRVYDRELVVLEGDWLNGEHETLSPGFQNDAERALYTLKGIRLLCQCVCLLSITLKTFLSEIFVTLNKWEFTLAHVLDLIKRVKTKTKSGAAIIDYLFDIFDMSSHDQILHKSISHILAAVEHILICHIGKWVISGARSPGFFIEEIENSSSGEGTGSVNVNNLPNRIDDVLAEKICFVGNSLRILKFQSEINAEELRNYSS